MQPKSAPVTDKEKRTHAKLINFFTCGIHGNLMKKIQIQGDSGGPLLCGPDQNVVYGVTSYGDSCGGETPTTSTYVNVSNYVDFIARALQKLDSKPKLI